MFAEERPALLPLDPLAISDTGSTRSALDCGFGVGAPYRRATGRDPPENSSQVAVEAAGAVDTRMGTPP